jgi:hypothetical protein
MQLKIKFTPTANQQLTDLENTPSKSKLVAQIRKTLGYLELDPRHPGLHTHEFLSLKGAHGEKIFEAYAQNSTPGAYRIFWHYGPDEIKGKKRIPAITIVAITPHP